MIVGPLDGKRILVIEDDFYLASDEKALLERAGATVVGPFRASRGGQDIDMESLDAAVVDINLGDGPKFDFAHLLKARNVPFLFVTGYDKAVIPEELSATPRIEKPVREPDLLSALALLVGNGDPALS
jgi:DNA-binding response OmpR family regulator